MAEGECASVTAAALLALVLAEVLEIFDLDMDWLVGRGGFPLSIGRRLSRCAWVTASLFPSSNRGNWRSGNMFVELKWKCVGGELAG